MFAADAGAIRARRRSGDQDQRRRASAENRETKSQLGNSVCAEMTPWQRSNMSAYVAKRRAGGAGVVLAGRRVRFFGGTVWAQPAPWAGVSLAALFVAALLAWLVPSVIKVDSLLPDAPPAFVRWARWLARGLRPAELERTHRRGGGRFHACFALIAGVRRWRS